MSFSRLVRILFCVAALAVCASSASASIAPDLFDAQLFSRGTYRSGIPVLVRFQIVDKAGRVERGLWDATATLTVDDPNVTFSPAEITMYNGLGSALVTFAADEDFILTAAVGGLAASRSLTNIDAEPIIEVNDASAGDSSTWSGTVHITDDLTIPSNHTLTIEPGTLILLDGASSGSGGADIDVRGSIQSLGTADDPITFTAFETGRNWGELHHDDADPSLFRYTNFHRAGRSPGVGHSGTGPTFRVSGSTLIFEHSNLTDNAGKLMHATSSSDLTFRKCLFARSVMGPEISSTALLFENSWITEMSHRDDADGIYVHSQRSDQTCVMRTGVVAKIVDDGIDLLGADITIEDFIVRDCDDKGISAFNGETAIIGCLVVNNNRAPEDPTVTSVAAKARAGVTTTVNIDRTTIVSTRTPGVIDYGIQSHEKYGYTTGAIIWHVTNSIIDATDPINTQFPYLDSDVHVSYSNIFGEPWPGTGNINIDPQFVDPNSGNYHLKSQAGHWNPLSKQWIPDETTSPCIDTGNPADPIGQEPFPNGGLVNMGFYAATPQASRSYFNAPPCKTITAGDINGDCTINFKDFALMATHWAEDNSQ